jgi:CBS domain-containing protein
MNAHAIQTRAATITENETVAEAARRMRDLHVGDLVVVGVGTDGDEKAPLGVLTEQDIVAGIVALGAGQLARLRVGEMLDGGASGSKA